MAKKKEGFFEGMLKDIAFGMAVEASKDDKGKPDPYKAAGIAIGMGHTESSDVARLGAMLAYQGAFDDESSDFNDLDSDDSDEWRAYCEDGWEYDLDPEDYETEEEYEDALQEAKYGWRETCEDGWEYGLDPEDYETEEEYEDAIETISDNTGALFQFSFNIEPADEYRQRKKDICSFIINNRENVLAARYLTSDGQFLYAKAVKENFELSISLPEEKGCREYEFRDIICKIAKRDEQLSLRVWSWCVEKFLPYAEYDEYAKNDMTNEVIDRLYECPEDYRKTLAHYMEGHPGFRIKIAATGSTVAGAMPDVIVAAIQEELYSVAKQLFDISYAKIKDDWKEIIDFTNEMMFQCRNYDELESMEYFEKELFPVIRQCRLGMVKDEIDEWKQEIADYIKQMEESCEKYEFSRRNAWRCHVPDGREFGMDPRDYSDEKEYMESYERYKYGWRKWYRNVDICGVNPNDYETDAEFRQALNIWKEELRKKKEEEQFASKFAEFSEDKTIYTYCGVMLPHSKRPYSYRTNDTTIKIGDEVIVPVGKGNEEVKGTVVSIGQYARIAVPFPIEQTRFVIRRA